jgi:tripartite-type tricarboxylate transporter receptor subunit TctC
MEKELKRGKKKGGLNRLIGVSSFFLLVVLSSPLSWAAEEPFPNKPITIIVSMAPGGVMDAHAQIIGERLGKVLGQPVIRVHKPGAGGVLAASFAAKAKADGYSLFTGTSSNLIMPPS